jgi:hypothetical protein
MATMAQKGESTNAGGTTDDNAELVNQVGVLLGEHAAFGQPRVTGPSASVEPAERTDQSVPDVRLEHAIQKGSCPSHGSPCWGRDSADLRAGI